MEFYSCSPDELLHYGVKGMKWGVRREYARADSKRKELGRKLAASRQNLLDKASESDENVRRFKDRTESYSKTAGRVAFTRDQKERKEADLAVEENEMHKAAERLKNTRLNFAKAKAWYEQDAKAYEAQVNSMMDKFGPETVKRIKTRNYKAGENFSKNMIDTGITMADIPVIGKSYRDSYIARKDATQRQENVDRMLEEERKKYY